MSFKLTFSCFSISNNKNSQQYMVPFLKNSFLEANAIDECVTDGWIIKFQRIHFICENIFPVMQYWQQSQAEPIHVFKILEFTKTQFQLMVCSSWSIFKIKEKSDNKRNLEKQTIKPQIQLRIPFQYYVQKSKLQYLKIRIQITDKLVLKIDAN